MAAPRMKLTIDGRVYSIDDLELDEIAELEEALGVPFAEFEFGSTSVMKHFAHHFLVKEDPDFTLEAAGKLKLSAFLEDEEEAEEEDAGPPVSSEALNGSSGTASESTGTSSETNDPEPAATGLR